MEGGKEGSIAVEDGMNTRGDIWSGVADGRDESGKNGSEAGKCVCEVDVSDGSV